MPTPEMPDSADVDPRYPWVIDQRPGPNHTVRVTFALPGLRRAIVTVPESSWLNGEHIMASHLAHALLDSLEFVPVDETVVSIDDGLA
jgi:hypothetical protein